MNKHTEKQVSVYKFEKGVRMDLDSVYHVISILPNECYDQGDEWGGRHSEYDLSEDEVMFTKNVVLTISLEID